MGHIPKMLKRPDLVIISSLGKNLCQLREFGPAPSPSPIKRWLAEIGDYGVANLPVRLVVLGDDREGVLKFHQPAFPPCGC
jgi:hypothetical protein